ncbi:sensor histidine kinase [Naumannella huperziae]
MTWRRIPLGDWLLAAAAAAMAAVAGSFVVEFGPAPEYLAYLAIHLGLVAALLFRRAAVLPAFVATYGLLAALAVLIRVGRTNLGVTPLLFAAPLALYAVTRWAPDRRWGVAALLLGIAGSFVSPISELGGGSLVVALHVLVMVAVYLWASQQRGIADRHRRELAEQERRHAERAAQAARDERALIAREVHDVVAHSLAVVQVQAATSLAIGDPDRLRGAMGDIRQVSSAALDEVRDLVGVLRVGDQASPTGDLTRIPGLVAAAGNAARLEVRLPDPDRLRGWQDAWPALARLTVLRIVQEGLANLIKHGGSRPTGRVLVELTDDRAAPRCHIMISNELDAGPGTGRAPGYGLIGLRERVALVVGSIEAGAQDGRFVLSAWIPVGTSDA